MTNLPQVHAAERHLRQRRFAADVIKRRTTDFLSRDCLVGKLHLQIELEQLFGVRPRQLLIAPLPYQLVAEGVDAAAQVGAHRGFRLHGAGGSGDGAVAGVSSGCDRSELGAEAERTKPMRRDCQATAAGTSSREWHSAFAIVKLGKLRSIVRWCGFCQRIAICHAENTL